jgi:hypothetical protein
MHTTEEEVEEISTTYTYQQLTDEAKEKVKQWWCEHGIWDDWYDDTYERFKEEGYALGFVIDKMNFTGFYSQGDGACWEGQIDVATWLKTHTEDSIARDAWCALIAEDFCDKHFSIHFRGRYSHSNTMTCVGWDWVSEMEDEPASYLKQSSIFKGMRYSDLYNLIRTSDFPYTDPNDIEQAGFESAKEYADELYKRLREEYEYLTSEESLIESCDANDWQFNEEGEMV